MQGAAYKLAPSQTSVPKRKSGKKENVRKQFTTQHVSGEVGTDSYSFTTAIAILKYFIYIVCYATALVYTQTGS